MSPNARVEVRAAPPLASPEPRFAQKATCRWREGVHKLKLRTILRTSNGLGRHDAVERAEAEAHIVVISKHQC